MYNYVYFIYIIYYACLRTGQVWAIVSLHAVLLCQMKYVYIYLFMHLCLRHIYMSIGESRGSTTNRSHAVTIDEPQGFCETIESKSDRTTFCTRERFNGIDNNYGSISSTHQYIHMSHTLIQALHNASTLFVSLTGAKHIYMNMVVKAA